MNSAVSAANFTSAASDRSDCGGRNEQKASKTNIFDEYVNARFLPRQSLGKDNHLDRGVQMESKRNPTGPHQSILEGVNATVQGYFEVFITEFDSKTENTNQEAVIQQSLNKPYFIGFYRLLQSGKKTIGYTLYLTEQNDS